MKYITFTDFLFDEDIDHYNIFKNYGKIKSINYSCILCNKFFKRKDNLERHIICIHKKLERYKCNNCYKIIIRKDNYKYHQLNRCKFINHNKK